MGAFDDTPGLLLLNLRSYVNACYYLILSIIYEICATIGRPQNTISWTGSEALYRDAALCWISSQQHSHSVDVLFKAFQMNGALSSIQQSSCWPWRPESVRTLRSKPPISRRQMATLSRT